MARAHHAESRQAAHGPTPHVHYFPYRKLTRYFPIRQVTDETASRGPLTYVRRCLLADLQTQCLDAQAPPGKHPHCRDEVGGGTNVTVMQAESAACRSPR